MPRAFVTCQWKRRGCGSRLEVELATGTGLPSQDLCPRCGEAGALRHLLVQTRTRWPNRVWTVASSRVVPTAPAEGAPSATAQAPRQRTHRSAGRSPPA